MDTLVRTKNTANDLQLKIQKHLEELAKATEAAKKSEVMLNYLTFCARFHNYSASNIWLIMLAKPEASYVAGFHKWKSLGRWVRKGEKGIPILAPILVKGEEQDGLETQHLVGFKVVYVFDVSQTDGEPLPPEPDWKSPEKNRALNQRLLQFAKSRGIVVSFKTLPGDIQGVSRGGAIEIDHGAGTKTLVHEIAHELMHQEKDKYSRRAIKELEAESVAFVVCRYFGISGLNSPNYLVLMDVSVKEMITHMESIADSARKIITTMLGSV